jgi:hypothetical protein
MAATFTGWELPDPVSSLHHVLDCHTQSINISSTVNHPSIFVACEFQEIIYKVTTRLWFEEWFMNSRDDPY